MTDKNKNTVDFQRIAVSEFLSNAIYGWRKIRDDTDIESLEARKSAGYYIEAYQAVHLALFGRLIN